MKTSKKMSDTSIRVLETLKFLTKEKASIQDIIRHFEKTEEKNPIYTNEAILKYINTLKVFGIKFNKNKDKYILTNSLVQFDFSEKDLNALQKLEKYSNAFPESKIKSEVNMFLQDLEKQFSDNTKFLSHNVKKNNSANFDFNYEKYLSQIKEYEKYCIDEQRLKITYKKTSKIESSIIAEPIEIKYTKNKVYFSVYNPLSAQIQDINLDSIIKTEQLPSRSNPANMLSSVTFKLKDRLAKVYKLHEGEKLMQKNSDDTLIILNQKEDRDLLIKRLMRYGENCEIISPKNLRTEMNEIIKSTLANYNC